MKLRNKILLISLFPLLMVGVVVVIMVSQYISSMLLEEIGTSLKANAYSLRDAIEMGTQGGYYVDDNGDMIKGYKKVAQTQTMMDEIKKETGIVLTVFYGDTRMVTSVTNEDGTYAVGTQASQKVVDKVLKSGDELLADNVDVNGEKYFAFYSPIYNEGEDVPVGMVFAGMKQSSLDAKLRDVATGISLFVVVLILGSGVVISIFTARLVKAIKGSVAIAERVSTGDLSGTIDEKQLKRKDEIGDITRAVSHLQTELVDIISDIKNKSDVLIEASVDLDKTARETSDVVSQVERAVQEIADGATSQATETQKATSNVIFMGDMVEETNREVEQLKINAEDMKEYSASASGSITELQLSSHKSSQSIEDIYRQTVTTNESALKIKEATSLITSIADETNLLSLNASIEAARAGEQGRGFAVVAAQIQKLAEQSNESAREIDAIVNLLIADSTSAVRTMEEVKQIIDAQNEHVEKTGQLFNTVMSGIDESIRGVESIAERTRKLDGARVSVVDVVQNLTAIAEENAASTEETSASAAEVASIISNVSESAEQLKLVADGLELKMNIFKF